MRKEDPLVFEKQCSERYQQLIRNIEGGSVLPFWSLHTFRFDIFLLLQFKSVALYVLHHRVAVCALKSAAAGPAVVPYDHRVTQRSLTLSTDYASSL